MGELGGSPGDDLISLVFNGGNGFSINGSNVNAMDQFVLNETYTAGQNISLTHLDGNGFRLQAITLDIQITSIPERSGMLPLACLTGFAVRKRRRQR